MKCIYFLFLASTFLHGDDSVLERKVLQITGEVTYLDFCRDMIFAGDRLYLIENQRHRVLQIDLSTPENLGKVIARKGEGPGEVWLPIELAPQTDGGFVVQDNRGFSFFGADGCFQDRFAVYTAWIAFTARDKRLFYLSAAPHSDFLIHVFQNDGEKIQSFMPKYLKVTSAAGDAGTIADHEGYFYRAVLAADGEFLYYLNSTMGRFDKYTLSGELVLSRNAAVDFGPQGMFLLEKNREYLAHPAKMEKPTGYLAYEMFQDAYLAHGKLYILRWVDFMDDFTSERKDILVFDTKTLTLERKLHFTLKTGEMARCIAVRGSRAKPEIFTTIDSGDDIHLVTLE
ncbi:MAG: hypothetical protein QNK37_12090 [Acidobacteriota bacterium]|nr:hypothetical protein [Acidobacteriota bacterium]